MAAGPLLPVPSFTGGPSPAFRRRRSEESDCGRASPLAPPAPLAPVYSLRAVSAQRFADLRGAPFLMHAASAALRVLAGLLVLFHSFFQTGSGLREHYGEGTEIPPRAVRLYYALLGGHYVVGVLTAGVLVFAGLLSAVYLRSLFTTPAEAFISNRYGCEILGFYLSFAVSVLYFLWCICLRVVVKDAYCTAEAVVIPSAVRCGVANQLLFGTAFAAPGLIGALLPLFLWTGAFFRLYIGTGLLRLALGLALALQCWSAVESLRSVEEAAAGAATDMAPDGVNEMHLLRKIFLFNSVLGSIPQLLSGAYGLWACFRRSQYIVLVDGVVQFFLFWLLLVLAISTSWPYTISATFFANYPQIYVSHPSVVVAQFNRVGFTRRVIANGALLAVGTAAALAGFVLALAGLVLPACAPREWGIGLRLAGTAAHHRGAK